MGNCRQQTNVRSRSVPLGIAHLILGSVGSQHTVLAALLSPHHKMLRNKLPTKKQALNKLVPKMIQSLYELSD